MKNYLFGKYLMAVFFLVAVAHTTNGNAFYISSSGSDTEGNGSRGKPWKSLFKAANEVRGIGDIIHVLPGVYIETKTSILAVGVSIEGDEDKSVIKSSVEGAWTALISARSEEGTNGNQHISGIVLDGQQMTGFLAIWVAGRSNVSIFKCLIKDFKDRGVIFEGRNDNQPGPPKAYATGNRFYENKVDNCAAYNNEYGIYGRGCLNIGGQENLEIHDNVITQLSRPDGFNGWPIKYSSDGYLKSCRIYRNILKKIPFAGSYGGDNGWDFAVELWNLEGAVEIYGNDIQGAVDLVQCGKGDQSYGVWFHDNTIAQEKLNRHYESGVIIEQSAEYVIIEKNTFSRISGGIHFNAQKGTVIENVVIRKNKLGNIGRNSASGNNGCFLNCNMGNLLGPSEGYLLKDFYVIDNEVSMSAGNAPLYGLIFSGYETANNVHIQRNRLENVYLAWLTLNPANAMDSISLVRNSVIGDGNGGDALYINGKPLNQIIAFHSVTSGISGTAVFKTRIREKILRPLYYESKTLSEFNIIIGALLLLYVFFFLKSSKMSFPSLMVACVFYGFEGFIKDNTGNIVFASIVALCSVISWIVWHSDMEKRKAGGKIDTKRKYGNYLNLILFGLATLIAYIIFKNFKLLNGHFELILAALVVSSLWSANQMNGQGRQTGVYFLVGSSFLFGVLSYCRNSLIDAVYFYFLSVLLLIACQFIFRKRLFQSKK